MTDFADAVQLLNSAKKPVIVLTGKPPTVSVMDDDLDGRITLSGKHGNMFLRAKRKTGQLVGDLVFVVDADTGNLLLGGGETNGDLLVHPAGPAKPETATLHYSAKTKRLVLKGANNQASLRIEGAEANVWVGGSGMDGDIVVHPSTVANEAPSAMSSIHLSGDGSLVSIKSGGVETIKLDGAKGDIVLLNADGAEEFDVADKNTEPGAVLVIDDESRLRVADTPYDHRVAGVVSGAGGIRPGIVLGRNPAGRRVPVALFGRVLCRADASYGAIAPGDLLTSSLTRGHAMRAEPGRRALGSVIGKAMSGLPEGRGLVPVLVALQ
jgi:predicted regulator of Ras-like GTPase activity (Roadblock/LC7/MglB family)